MGYTVIERGKIDTSIIYVTPEDLMKRTGVPKSTFWNHIRKDKLDAIKFCGKTFFTQKQADEYESLVKCGLLG